MHTPDPRSNLKCFPSKKKKKKKKLKRTKLLICLRIDSDAVPDKMSRDRFSCYSIGFESTRKALVKTGFSNNRKRGGSNGINNMTSSFDRQTPELHCNVGSCVDGSGDIVEGAIEVDPSQVDEYLNGDTHFMVEDVDEVEDAEGNLMDNEGGDEDDDEEENEGTDSEGNQNGYVAMPIENQMMTESQLREFMQASDQYASFSIESEIDLMLASRLNNIEAKNAKAKETITLCDGTEGEISTLCKKLHSAFVLAGIDLKSRNEILGAIDAGFHCSLPRYSYNEQRKGSMVEITTVIPSVLKFHVCPNGDHVYVGKSQYLLKCPIESCQRSRVRKCLQPACKDIPITEMCPHFFEYRNPFRWVQYRPLCVYLQMALEHPMFYKFACSKFSNTLPGGIAWDVMQKRVAQEQMEFMQNTWDLQPKEIKDSCKPLNLLFGINYDGVRIYAKKTSNFNPLLLFVLNLPPNLRSKKGIGMFPVSIFDAVVGVDFTDSEQFLMWKCLVEELVALEKGKVIEIVDDQGLRHRYFIQGRVILHCYDTRALEKVMRILSTNSFAWCFLCGAVQGSRFVELGNTCNIGNRGLLSLDSVLRYMGQSMSCCPRGFYGSHISHAQYEAPDQSIDKNAETARTLYQCDQAALCIQPGMEDSIIDNIIPCCVGNGHDQMLHNMLKDQFRFSWKHSDIITVALVVPMLGKYLYYEHMDLRPVIPYARTTNLQYFNKGKGAFVHRKKTEFCQDGVKGIYSFAILKHSDISRHLCWDPFHILVLLAEHLIALWKNQRATSAKVRIYCSKGNIHPTVQRNADIEAAEQTTKQGKKRKEEPDLPGPAWTIPSRLQNLIDNVIAVMMLPTNAKSDFQIKSIFHATGHLNGISKIKVVAVLIDVVNFCLHHFQPEFPEAYCYLFKIISDDVSIMMSRGFTDHAADQLFERMVEMVCLYEGMFPPCESLASIHHLIDIAAHIKTFGPISSWWALSGERAVGDVADKNPGGGSSTYVTAFQREYHECDVVLQKEWKINKEQLLQSLQQHGNSKSSSNDYNDSFILTNANNNIVYDEENDCICVVPPKTYILTGRGKFCVTLNLKENKLLLQALFHRFKLVMSNLRVDSSDDMVVLNRICSRSIFFRLFMFLRALKSSNRSFLRRIYQHFQGCLTQQEKEQVVHKGDDTEYVFWVKYGYKCLRSALKTKLAKVADIIKETRPNDDAHSYLSLMSGIIYSSDYSYMRTNQERFFDLNLHTLCSFHQVVSHRGITLRGRLHHHSRFDEPTSSRLSETERCLNRDKWYLSTEINSWSFINHGDNNLQEVGQISYFVKLDRCAEEEEFNDHIWVHFLGYSMEETVHKPIYSRLRFVNAIATSTSHGKFVSIDDVAASAIAVLPLYTIDSKPHKIFASSFIGLKCVGSQRSQLTKFFTQNRELVNMLCLIPLQPYNRYIDHIGDS